MPVLIFTRDHRAQTIDGIVQAVKKFQRDNAGHGVAFKLASGNVGVWAATNEEIRARELLVIIWVHATLALFTRSEEHTSELQSLMRISYAVFCLKKKNKRTK